MTPLIGDLIIPVSDGFDLGRFIWGSALVSTFALTFSAVIYITNSSEAI